ncbi:MAG: hypothetical protein KatS3mg076_2591 [Candidatus Binatia bacterium]|nr:MAG: hypothetical protein KatS3mg076_2591 [Candidatus Binatia bacterium]
MTARFKKILNLHEQATHLRLRKACEPWGASVHLKVRVADVLPIEGSGITRDQYEFALKSHFDFLVTDSDHSPLFAVEFDGPPHLTREQRARDDRKNKLCDRFSFPLLRINCEYLLEKHRQMDLLTWFVEVWFLKAAFAEAQQKGEVSWDEPFTPGSIMTLPGRKEPFPLWLSLDARVEIGKLHLAGKCHDYAPSSAVGMDSANNYRAIAYILTVPRRGLVAQTGMRSHRFPIPISELLEDIVVLELFLRLKDALVGRQDFASVDVIEERCRTFRSKYRVVSAFESGDRRFLLP